MSVNKWPFNWIKSQISSLSIAKKIGYGYSLAIGIAVLGTTVGLITGDSYQTRAQKQLRLADRQQYILHELEKSVLVVRSHPQQLVTVIEDSIWFQYETSQFLENVDSLSYMLSEINNFIDSYPRHLAVDVAELQALLQDYEITIESYSQLIQSLWQEIALFSAEPEGMRGIERQILMVIRGKEAIQIRVQFERLSERLSRILEAAEAQKNLANDGLIKSEKLRLHIIIGSMGLSTAIAVCLAVYTSRAIASPLKAVTLVAQRVTQKSDFNLQATVATKDEIGLLAVALNQLIQWVGEYTHQLEIARDTLEKRVTERTQELAEALADLKQTQVQLIQTEKMSSLGQMVAGIAHEINNPVNFIHGNIKYIQDHTQELLQLVDIYARHCPEPPPEIQDAIDEYDLEFLREDIFQIVSSMNRGTERIKAIVLSLRNFSRLDESEFKAVDIHEGIENTLLVLNYHIQQGIEVIKDYGDIPFLLCCPAQLNQVFMQIITNAIDAILETDNQSKKILIQTEKVGESQVIVRIRDNGPGIPPQIIDKIFDPFFTTKPVGKGTGLGLSVCYQIVEKHGGKIEVISELGEGTELAIALPIPNLPQNS